MKGRLESTRCPLFCCLSEIDDEAEDWTTLDMLLAPRGARLALNRLPPTPALVPPRPKDDRNQFKFASDKIIKKYEKYG